MGMIISIGALTPIEKERYIRELPNVYHQKYENSLLEFKKVSFFDYMSDDVFSLMVIDRVFGSEKSYDIAINKYIEFVDTIKREYMYTNKVVIIDICPIDIALLYKEAHTYRTAKPTYLEIKKNQINLDALFIGFLYRKDYRDFSRLTNVDDKKVNDYQLTKATRFGGQYRRFINYSNDFGFPIHFIQNQNQEKILTKMCEYIHLMENKHV